MLCVFITALLICGSLIGNQRDFQGAVQGPEEFAEGLATGVKSLFGHTVGELALKAFIHYMYTSCSHP